jgi:RNA polymerase sigma factor (TIGR02999 family)
MSNPGGNDAQASASHGAPRAIGDDMLTAHYHEFRRVAAGVLNGSANSLQLQPTELAHEAVVRLARLDRMDVAGRTHLLSLSARVMRQILVDEVRKMRARKRQAPPVNTLWPEGDLNPGIDVEALDRALTKLEAASPDYASLVERRFFVGLTLEEIAVIDGVSVATLKRQWRAARAWLVAELGTS